MLFKSLLQAAAVGASLMCSVSAAVTVQKAKRQDSVFPSCF